MPDKLLISLIYLKLTIIRLSSLFISTFAQSSIDINSSSWFISIWRCRIIVVTLLVILLFVLFPQLFSPNIFRWCHIWQVLFYELLLLFVHILLLLDHSKAVYEIFLRRDEVAGSRLLVHTSVPGAKLLLHWAILWFPWHLSWVVSAVVQLIVFKGCKLHELGSFRWLTDHEVVETHLVLIAWWWERKVHIKLQRLVWRVLLVLLLL